MPAGRYKVTIPADSTIAAAERYTGYAQQGGPGRIIAAPWHRVAEVCQSLYLEFGPNAYQVSYTPPNGQPGCYEITFKTDGFGCPPKYNTTTTKAPAPPAAPSLATCQKRLAKATKELCAGWHYDYSVRRGWNYYSGDERCKNRRRSQAYGHAVARHLAGAPLAAVAEAFLPELDFYEKPEEQAQYQAERAQGEGFAAYGRRNWKRHHDAPAPRQTLAERYAGLHALYLEYYHWREMVTAAAVREGGAA